MSDESKKAMKYLEGIPLTVKYIEMGESGDTSRDVFLLIEEYPDFIPNKEDVVMINEKVYVVINRVYSTDKNELYIVAQDKQIYENIQMNRYAKKTY